MMWGYRRRTVEEEFGTREELVAYLERMDPMVLRSIRYWYIEDCFEPAEVLRNLVDGEYTDMTPNDWLNDALNNIEDGFACGEWDWKEDTIDGIYYKEEE